MVMSHALSSSNMSLPSSRRMCGELVIALHSLGMFDCFTDHANSYHKMQGVPASSLARSFNTIFISGIRSLCLRLPLTTLFIVLR